MAFSVPSDRRGLIVMAKVAEQCERYDEMLVCMKALVQMDPNLNLDERNLLSVAYKQVLTGRRAPWQTLQRFPREGSMAAVIPNFEKQMVGEIAEVCNDIFNLLESHLIPAAKEADVRVFYYKLKADYHRYYVEVLSSSSETHKEQRAAARDAYTKALEAAKGVEKESPTVLGLKLNYSVFLYEVEREQEAGYEVALACFKESCDAIDGLSEDAYREAATILSLLQDNLGTWADALGKQPQDGGEDAMEVEDL